MITTGRLMEHDQPRALADFVAAASRPDRPWTIPFPLGEDVDQEMRFADLADGHVLVAGSTGSGKTRFIQSLVASIVRACEPDDVRMLIIDGKGLDLATVFRDMPHNLCEPITEIDDAIGAVNWVTHEMDRRRRILRNDGTPHIWAYQAAREQHGLAPGLPALCLVIDEVQALTQTSADAMRNLIRLSQQGRASGILLVLATQRPTRIVIDPAIKANLPYRICFRVPSQVDSRVALDRHGAEQLRHPGELIAVLPTMNEAVRLTAPFVSDEDLLETVEPLRPPMQTVAALPPADAATRPPATAVSDEEQTDDAAPACNSTPVSMHAATPSMLVSDPPSRSTKLNSEGSDLAALSCFADVELEESIIAAHLGHEVGPLCLVYSPTVVLDLQRLWRHRQLLVDVLTGRLFVTDAPPRSIPFLDALANLDEAERKLLASARSGSPIRFDKAQASSGWRLVEQGLFDAVPRGFRINRDLRHPPTVRAISMSMLPRYDAPTLPVSADLMRMCEEGARREVARLWRPGAMATSIAGLPYWRWHSLDGRLLDIPAWARPRRRAKGAAVARQGLLASENSTSRP